MEICNYDKLKGHLLFDSEYDFYFLQIIQRKKDNIGFMSADNKIIKNYYIRNVQYLEDRMSDIKDICTYFNARAMLRLNRRNSFEMYHDLILEMGKMGKSKHYNNARAIFDRACGKCNHEPKHSRTWVIDVDTKSNAILEGAIHNINSVRPLDNGSKVLDILNTPNGFHVITRPFDMKQFNKTNTFDIGIQKNNPTLLYSNLK